MAITDNPKLEYESGQNYNDWEDMTDTGDAMVFEATFAPWSGRSGFEAEVRPWGLATGGSVRAGAGNDTVTVAALTAYMPGAVGAAGDGLVNVASADVTISRATADTHMITSITVDASGALVAIYGAEGTAFTEARGAAGGPAFIPVDSIEIGQVRTSSAAAASVSDTEVFQVVGIHQERYDAPVLALDPLEGTARFFAELPKIHTGGVPKKVSVRGYTPIFAEMPRISGFVPAEYSYSSSSTDTSTGPVTSSTRSTSNSTFTYYGENGITDPIVGLEGENLWFRWFQNRYSPIHLLQQGRLGFARSFAMGERPTFSATLIPNRNAVPQES